MSEISDANDRASDEEERFRREALLRAHRVARPTHPDFDGVHCLECAEELSKFRLGMFALRCVDCQELFERPRRMYKGM